MSDGRRQCWYRGTIRIRGKWYCRRHAIQVTAVKKSKHELENNEILAIAKMVKYYDQHGNLGEGVDFQELWASLVPRMLREILLHRKIK